MRPELRKWVKEAIELAKEATANNVLILLRNDDDEVVITNATNAETVCELGRALACGYIGKDNNYGDTDQS